MAGPEFEVGGVSVNGSEPAAEPAKRQSIPDDVRWDVWLRDGFRCVKCRIHRNLVIDHIVPVVDGGANDPENLQTLCSTCNARKHTTGWEEFLEKTATSTAYNDFSNYQLRAAARSVIAHFMESGTAIGSEFELRAHRARVEVAFRVLREITLRMRISGPATTNEVALTNPLASCPVCGGMLPLSRGKRPRETCSLRCRVAKSRRGKA